jgi:hypothetical protein
LRAVAREERIARNDWSKGRTQSTVERKLPKDLSYQPPVISKLQSRNRDQKSDHRNERKAENPRRHKARREPHPDPESLFGEKTKVTYETAATVLGVSVRRVRELASEERLEKIGQGHTAGISTDSLRARLGIPRKPEQSGTERK